MTQNLLIDIKGLRVLFHGDDGRSTHAVDSVDLALANGVPARPCRRIRLWQERHLTRHHGAVAEAVD